MASYFSILLLLLPLLCCLCPDAATTSCYQSIISFGDTYADTGNFIRTPGGDTSQAARFPYGETYFGRPTGRFSDGRLMIDFIAEALGLPFLPPFLGGGRGFRHGVNFAVAEATALDNEVFIEKGWNFGWTNYSLSVQVEQFKQLLPSVCASASECKEVFGKTLFLVGEIGANDYNFLFFHRIKLDDIKCIVPKVVEAIGSTISDLISLGARTLVVPGNFPIGCVSLYLSLYQSESIDDYDPHTGCINWLNEFSEYHNQELLQELDRLRKQHPSATIIYADYYNAALNVYRSPKVFGIDVTLRACCGGGSGPYNVDPDTVCGDKESNICGDPSKYVCWDGTHLTEAAYRAIADMLLNGSFATPAINYICPQIEMIKEDQ